MNEKQIRIAVTLAIGGAIIARGVYQHRQITKEHQEKRKAILNEMGLDVAAIHNATDIINERIEKGEIRSYEQLKEHVVNEVAFQKITIREDPEA